MVKNKIADILALWQQAHEEKGTSEEDGLARDRFANLMRARGWKHHTGGFKSAMIKGDLVAKFAYCGGDDEHTKKEWNIWRRSPAYKRRFLARCYLFERGLLIQKYHPAECRKHEDCKIGKRFASRFRIYDWGFNHSHRPSGLPVFFDYDNNGSGWDAWKRRRLSRRAA